MRRLNYSPNQNMKHFSHPHELELWNNTDCSQDSIFCSCCKLPLSGYVYRCSLCNFILHSTCAQFPAQMIHPSHINHTLILLPTPSYPGGIFNCDACNSQGNGFSYHCSSCEYDLHVICASKPMKIMVPFHSCPLELTFKNPYDNAKGFHCDVCRKIEFKQWLYRCGSCEFDVHLDCTLPVNQEQVHFLQHQHHSSSGEIVHNQNYGLLKPNQHIPSASLRTVLDQQFQANPVASGQFNGPVRPNYFASSASIGSIQNMVQPIMTNNLTNVAIEGNVEGASQQLSQSLVPNMIGEDGSSYGGGFPGGDDGSSFPGITFGDSLGL